MEKATVELNLSRSARSARAFLAKAADRCKKLLLAIRAEQQREGKKPLEICKVCFIILWSDKFICLKKKVSGMFGPGLEAFLPLCVLLHFLWCFSFPVNYYTTWMVCFQPMRVCTLGG